MKRSKPWIESEAMKAPALMTMRTDKHTGTVLLRIRKWHPAYWLWWIRETFRRLRQRTYSAPKIHARVGNIEIEADHHGMGFTCTIDGERVKHLRRVWLSLEIDEPNLVTVEILPDCPKEKA